MRRADEHRRPPRLARDRLDMALVRSDESRAQQQVLRRIAGDGELREEDEVRALCLRRLEAVEDQLPVSVQIADDGVDLGEGESHALSLALFATLSRKPPSGGGRTP